MRAEYKHPAVLDDIIVPEVFENGGVYTVVLRSEDDKVFAVVEFIGKYCRVSFCRSGIRIVRSGRPQTVVMLSVSCGHFWPERDVIFAKVREIVFRRFPEEAGDLRRCVMYRERKRGRYGSIRSL